jgi:23S rRNA (cytidine1920-2'-O)/16S rRNA (cytidine1409-2'-O)-methyltransferase
MSKVRLDQLLVDRKLAPTREKARALILAGSVLVESQKSDKPGHSFPENCRIDVTERLPYVSRGGLKLAHALDHFDISVEGLHCLDVGASTGGFTDCLLQRGATSVCALDVGHNQLDWKIRTDPRVDVRESVNARFLKPEDFEHKFDFAVCDASFISTTLLLPAIHPVLTERGEMVILVKPQFEVEKDQVGKGGIIRDPGLHQAACDRVRAAVEQLGFRTDIIESPILGAEGNREFLLYARPND